MAETGRDPSHLREQAKDCVPVIRVNEGDGVFQNRFAIRLSERAAAQILKCR